MKITRLYVPRQLRKEGHMDVSESAQEIEDRVQWLKNGSFRASSLGLIELHEVIEGERYSVKVRPSAITMLEELVLDEDELAEVDDEEIDDEEVDAAPEDGLAAFRRPRADAERVPQPDLRLLSVIEALPDPVWGPPGTVLEVPVPTVHAFPYEDHWWPEHVVRARTRLREWLTQDERTEMTRLETEYAAISRRRRGTRGEERASLMEQGRTIRQAHYDLHRQGIARKRAAQPLTPPPPGTRWLLDVCGAYGSEPLERMAAQHDGEAAIVRFGWRASEKKRLWDEGHRAGVSLLYARTGHWGAASADSVCIRVDEHGAPLPARLPAGSLIWSHEILEWLPVEWRDHRVVGLLSYAEGALPPPQVDWSALTLRELYLAETLYLEEVRARVPSYLKALDNIRVRTLRELVRTAPPTKTLDAYDREVARLALADL